MNRTYFLGNSTPDGFVTSFWQEHRNYYGYFLKGGPGCGKSTLMKEIANAFGTETISLYRCASDSKSLDAVVLEERGIFVVDATAPHEKTPLLPYVSGEIIDLAECLNGDKIYANSHEISALHGKNQTAHQQAQNGMRGFTAMLDTIRGIGEKARIEDKTAAYAKRLAKRILVPQKNQTEHIQSDRISAAFTPNGWQTLTADGFDYLILEDCFGCAAGQVLGYLANSAKHNGIPCEFSRNPFQMQQPILHLTFPTLHLSILTVTPWFPSEINPIQNVKMQRFYDAEQLKAKKNLTKFCIHTAQSLSAHITQELQTALNFHDELEAFYVSAQNRKKLSALTERLISEIKTDKKRTAYA